MVETTFTLTQRELASAIRLAGLIACFQRRMLFWITAFYAATMMLMSVIIQDFTLGFLASYILGFFGACAVYVLFGGILYWVLWPIGARQQMRTSKELGGTIQCKGDEAGWHVRTAISASDIRWETYTKWSENADVLLIYSNRALFQIVPKRALTGPHDLDRIRAWLTNAGVPRVAPFR